MIGESIVGPQLETIEKLLKKLSLFAERSAFPRTSPGASELRGKPYREAYEMVFRENAYDFRLSDQSLFQFNISGTDIHNGSIRYCYYEAPIIVMSYEQFVAFELGLKPDESRYKNMIQEWGDESRTEYEDYVRSSDLKSAVTPLRYDCKANDYRPGIHPASHMHFGVENDIRVGTRRIMTPIAFVLFVIRQRYPDAWSDILKWNNPHQLCRNFRDQLKMVDEKYWCKTDEQELYLA